MPEGPSIFILKEEVQLFKEKKIGVSGNKKIEKEQLLNRKVLEFKSWGKLFLICFKRFYVKIHLLMFYSDSVGGKRNLLNV